MPVSIFAAGVPTGTANAGKMLDVGVPLGVSMFWLISKFCWGITNVSFVTDTGGVEMPGILFAEGAR